MALRRRLKQAFFAAVFIGFWFALIGAGWLIGSSLQPAPPVPTPTPSFQAIEVEQVDVVRHDGFIDVVARLPNPNQRSGVATYPVTFIARDAEGAEVTRAEVMTYLLPGILHYVPALNIATPRPVATVDVEVPPQPEFIDISPTVGRPQLGTVLRSRTVSDSGSGRLEVQRGAVTNSSTFDYNRVEVVAVALGPANEVIGIGTTFLGRLNANEQREFTVQWPLPIRPTQNVIIIASTNVFREDNILRSLGDPSRLR